ncbi:MAG: MBL fold metallo-hydrolase [Sedimentisphaerales bacterium]|nr:MBL fold metallo-hydrolase [Sedimentisphaerales bacterium]
MKKNITPLFILVFISCASLSFSQQRTSQPVDFQKISERLFQITGGRGANGGAYIGDNAVLVIDAKQDKESVEQVIRDLGKITDKPIRYLVNTHSDGDHIFGNRFFPESVVFISHENCRADFFLPGRNGSESEWKNPELAPFVPSVTFRDKMDLYLGSRKVEFWYFGAGHTTGDCVVYFPEEKTAFLGDQIFLGRPQLIHSYKSGNSFEHIKTLSKMLESIQAEKFCSGHSDIIDRAAVKNHIEQMKQLQEKVRALIKQGKTLEQVRSEFEQNQARLIESVYNEIKAGS